MIVNRADLFLAQPIKNMAHDKIKNNGVSHGLSEAGYDIRIKQDITFYPRDTHQPFDSVHVFTPPLRGGPIKNGRFCLASSIEEFEMPCDLVGIVHDKSTWARKGLSVFNTVIEPGWKGFLTLELVYHGQDKLHISAGSGIAQVVFHRTTQRAHYTGKYQDQSDDPVPALFSD